MEIALVDERQDGRPSVSELPAGARAIDRSLMVQVVAGPEKAELMTRVLRQGA